MKKDLTLLVLAAGMGSRFGGLKQIEPVGPNGEFILDYSIYDAIKAGFNKVVFIIKEENYSIFKDTIGKRLEDKIKVEYVFQNNDELKDKIKIPENRIKPLGTAHAIYCARNKINENFATINADDFYGKDAYIKAADFLTNCNDNEFAIIAYKVNNTLTENGEVKRGVLFTKDDYLNELIESKVSILNDKVIAKSLDDDKEFTIELEHPVSMNLFCLTPKIFDYIENDIINFFDDNSETKEYLLPNVVFDYSKKYKCPIKIITTNSVYLGMTYKEDLDNVKNGILKQIELGNYKNNLWN